VVAAAQVAYYSPVPRVLQLALTQLQLEPEEPAHQFILSVDPMEETLQYLEFQLQQLGVEVALDRLPNTIHVYQEVLAALEVAGRAGILGRPLVMVLGRLVREIEVVQDSQLVHQVLALQQAEAEEPARLVPLVQQPGLITRLV
jgi:hypothetical protein